MLTVIVGSMMSGKSSRLISIINSHIIAGNSVIVFKPQKDTRCGNKIITHCGRDYPAHSIKNSTDALNTYVDAHDVVCFDEAQFFDNYLPYEVDNLLKCGYEVICAGLSQDSFGQPFGPMPQLLCKADKIIHLTAVCVKCKSIAAATRTFRKVSAKEQVFIGGTSMYEARCFDCWKEDK